MVATVESVYRARILKHLLEAEKSTFREELSFQRSESTTGLLQGTVFVSDRKILFCEFNSPLKVIQMLIIKCFIIKNIITITLKPCTRTFS